MKHNKLYCVLFALCLVTHSIVLASASRTKGSNRKTSSNSHVTRPTHSTNTGNSHSDLAKLSYSNYNSQPNRPANTGTASHTPAPIGWNVPNKQGPPPAYSANNPVGGAKTNIHEAPPNYGASGTNVHTPITATNAHSVQSSYPGQHGASYPVQQGATYHSPGSLPPGATYYPGGHVPQGVPAGYPAGSAYPGGHMPVGGGSYYPAGGHVPQGATYYPAGGVPAGATYIPAGASLPPGATYYPQQPQSSSSGLGFGSGLAAGAIGGAILGHVLTPTETRVVEHAPAQSGSAGGDGKIIIINNGQPVTATQAANGTTIITTNGETAQPQAPSMNAPLAPMAPMAPAVNGSEPAPVAVNGSQPLPQEPPAGGIICVPVRVNETDPADSSKMIEVEKVACYPAPPPPPPPAVDANVNGTVPLAPMNPIPNQSQQIQQTPTQATLLPQDANVHKSGVNSLYNYISFATLIVSLLVSFGFK